MRFTKTPFTAVWLKWSPQQERWSPMDFQLARNLSALSRAQNEIAEALLHIDCLSDCLNREIIVSAACSEATDVQVQDMWRRNLTKELDAFARPKSLLLLLGAIALPAHRRPMRRIPRTKNQFNRHLEYRVVLRKDSPLVRDIHLRKLPFEAECGAMMLREKSE